VDDVDGLVRGHASGGEDGGEDGQEALRSAHGKPTYSFALPGGKSPLLERIFCDQRFFLVVGLWRTELLCGEEAKRLRVARFRVRPQSAVSLALGDLVRCGTGDAGISESPMTRAGGEIGAIGRVGSGIFAIAVGLSGHFHGDRVYLDRINTPSAERPAPVVLRGAPEKPAQRLWVVIVDGLRADVARQTPGLRELAEECPFRTIVADFPSFTNPGLVTLSTGLPPRYSGVRINGRGAVPEIDSVARRAIERGFAVRFVPNGFDELRVLLGAPAEAEERSIDALLAESRAPELAFIYFGEVDEAGHLYGADSEPYRFAAKRAGELALRARAALEGAEDALVVLSDHGQIAGGGHGGVEPDALAAFFIACGGPFVKSSALPPAPMRNVAATLSFAIGIEAPRSSIGRPMIDAFGLVAPQLDESAAASDEAATRAFERAAWPRALAASALALLVVAAVIALRTRLMLLWRDFVPALAYLFGFAVPYALLFGYGWSWSLPRGAPGFYIETILCGGAGVVLAFSCSRRDRRAQEALSIALLHGVPYLIFSAYVGVDTRELAGPVSSYGVILIATIEAYGCVPLGARALLPEKHRPQRSSARPRRPQGRRGHAPRGIFGPEGREELPEPLERNCCDEPRGFDSGLGWYVRCESRQRSFREMTTAGEISPGTVVFPRAEESLLEVARRMLDERVGSWGIVRGQVVVARSKK
jgi:hypothetical protein